MSKTEPNKLHTIPTHTNVVSKQTTKNGKKSNAYSNGNHPNRNIDDKKQIIVWQHKHTNKKIIDNIKQNMRNIIRTHYKHNKLNNVLEQFKNDFTINETYCKLKNNALRV